MTVTPHELARALARTYTIRGQNRSFSLTLPPALASPFIDRFGNQVRYEVVEEGILIRPVEKGEEAPLPAWMGNNGAEPQTKNKKR